MPADDNPNSQPSDAATTARQRAEDGKEARRWWIKLFVQPALLLACGVILIVGLGVAQRRGFISSGGGGTPSRASAADESVRYICPMMCTPPQSEPGRCPVCAMELVPATAGGGNADSRSIQIDPAARRVANIRTVAVTSMPMTRTIRAIGELNYDEGTLEDDLGLRRRTARSSVCRLHGRCRPRGRPSGARLFAATVFGPGGIAAGQESSSRQPVGDAGACDSIESRPVRKCPTTADRIGHDRNRRSSSWNRRAKRTAACTCVLRSAAR